MNPLDTQTPAPTVAPRRAWRADTLLGLSAALLACVLAVRTFGPGTRAAPSAFPLESIAMAGGTVSSAGGITMLTSETTSEDILLVVDSRNETLWVYRTESNNALTTQLRLGLPELFREARTRTTGKP